MDLIISKDALNKILGVTQNVVQKKTTMPILSNVLLTAIDGSLKVSASDLEITSVCSAEAKVKSTGSITVNAKVLSDIVRELPEGEVNLKVTEGERFEITAKSSKLRVIGISADEFPSLPGVGFQVSGRVSAEQFLEMINKTLYAVSQDETRYNLNGVCFELISEGKKGNKLLKMVATDGHRLALITRPVSSLEFKERVIVPRKGLNEIKRVLADCGDSEVGVDFKEGFLAIETKDSKISMRLIDGEFPDYKQVIPEKEGVVATVSARELSQALRRVSLLVTDKSKCVKVDFAPGQIRISSSSPELGDAKEEMPAEYKGAPLSVGFNARYLLDMALSVSEEQSLCIELYGELGPGKFYAQNDSSYIGIVMPMRLT